MITIYLNISLIRFFSNQTEIPCTEVHFKLFIPSRGRYSNRVVSYTPFFMIGDSVLRHTYVSAVSYNSRSVKEIILENTDGSIKIE